MELLRKLIRIYSPFLCTIVVFIHGVRFFLDTLTESFLFNASVGTGFSFATVLYFIATSKNMCKWYKLNLRCLLGICICSVLHKYFYLSITPYFYATIVLSGIGIVFILLYLITYGVIENLHRYKRL